MAKLYLVLALALLPYVQSDCSCGSASRTVSPGGTSFLVPPMNTDGTYCDYENCVWTLTANNGADQVRIDFDWFNLETDYDFLTIFDGANRNNRIERCTGLICDSVVSTRGALTVVFTTDNSTGFGGFTAKFYDAQHPVTVPGKTTQNSGTTRGGRTTPNNPATTNMPQTTANSACGPSRISIAKGKSTASYNSPNYPLSYSNNMHCTTVLAGNGRNVKITFNPFNLESCCDSLTIYDGAVSNNSMGVCTGQTCGPFTSSRGFLTAVFRSDGSVTRSGWAGTLSYNGGVPTTPGPTTTRGPPPGNGCRKSDLPGFSNVDKFAYYVYSPSSNAAIVNFGTHATVGCHSTNTLLGSSPTYTCQNSGYWSGNLNQVESSARCSQNNVCRFSGTYTTNQTLSTNPVACYNQCLGTSGCKAIETDSYNCYLISTLQTYSGVWNVATSAHGNMIVPGNTATCTSGTVSDCTCVNSGGNILG